MIEPDSMIAGELLTPSEAAERTGLSKSTLAKMRCDGTGCPFHRIGAKFVRYDSNDLDAWMRRHRFTSTSQASQEARA